MRRDREKKSRERRKGGLEGEGVEEMRVERDAYESTGGEETCRGATALGKSQSVTPMYVAQGSQICWNLAERSRITLAIFSWFIIQEIFLLARMWRLMFFSRL